MFLPGYIEMVLSRLGKKGFEAYAVGGCVRDFLMGNPPDDYDVTTSATPDEVKDTFFDLPVIDTGLKHGTVTVVTETQRVEVTTFRIDGKYSDNRRPDSVRFTRDLKDDLSRRDFTVNALAYNHERGIVDLFGGQRDINNKIIRAVGDPDARFDEDALRIMRALRFSSVLGFEIEKATAKSVHDKRHLLKNIASERIFVELTKLCCGSNFEYVIKNFADVFGVFIKGFNVDGTGFDALPSDKYTRIAALFFDMDEDAAVAALRALKCDNESLSRVKSVLSVRDFEINDERGARLLLGKIGRENALALCAIKKIRGKDFLPLVEKVLARGDCFDKKNLALDGRDLLTLGYSGEEIGRAQDRLLAAVIDDPKKNTKDALIRLLKEERL